MKLVYVQLSPDLSATNALRYNGADEWPNEQHKYIKYAEKSAVISIYGFKECIVLGVILYKR